MRRIILPSVAPLCSTIFFHSIWQRHDFRKNDFEHEICGLICSITFVWNILRSKKNSARYYHKLHRSSCILFVILVIFSRNLCFLNIFSINPQNIKYLVRPSSGSRVVPCQQTDKQTWWIYFIRNSWAPDDGHGTCPKHVEHLTRNNKEVLKIVPSFWNF
jgi:hypothetical protein